MNYDSLKSSNIFPTVLHNETFARFIGDVRGSQEDYLPYNPATVVCPCLLFRVIHGMFGARLHEDVSRATKSHLESEHRGSSQIIS